MSRGQLLAGVANRIGGCAVRADSGTCLISSWPVSVLLVPGHLFCSYYKPQSPVQEGLGTGGEGIRVPILFLEAKTYPGYELSGLQWPTFPERPHSSL